MIILFLKHLTYQTSWYYNKIPMSYIIQEFALKETYTLENMSLIQVESI